MLRLPEKIALTAFVAAASVISVFGQLPIPVPGQNPGPAPRGGGRGAQKAAVGAVKQVVAPIPEALEVTGPGEFYETFMDDHDETKKADIPAKDIYAKYNYVAKEYFISGT